MLERGRGRPRGPGLEETGGPLANHVVGSWNASGIFGGSLHGREVVAPLKHAAGAQRVRGLCLSTAARSWLR